MSVVARAVEPPTELDETQRQAVIAFYRENPKSGYKAALKAAGILQVPKGRAKELVLGDDEIREQIFKGYGLDEPTLFVRLGEIAADAEHKDTLRAITFGLNAIHRYAEHQRREVSGDVSQHVEVTVDHDVSSLVASLEAVGVLRRGPASAPDAPAALLPARADGAADGRLGGEPVSAG